MLNSPQTKNRSFWLKLTLVVLAVGVVLLIVFRSQTWRESWFAFLERNFRVDLSMSGAVADCSSLTDVAAHNPPAIPSRPAFRQEYKDPTFGACVTRVTDVAQHGADGVHDYSELQAWNADQSKILLQNGKIIDAGTSAVVRDVDFGYPEGGSGLRWSPTDPNVLYYVGQKVSSGTSWVTNCPATAARLVKYTLPAGTRELVGCFPEYVRFDKNRSFQSLSMDGRFIALVGSPRNGAACEGSTACEVFLYDLVNKAKAALLSIPGGTYLEWVEPSPMGNYLLVNYGEGGECSRCGVVSYDRTGNRVGQLATGHGHGSTALGPDGTEWYVVDGFSTSYAPGGNQPQILKARIPKGYDQWKAGDGSGYVSLLKEDWGTNQHISCKTPRSEWCVVGTYAMGSPGVPFYHEVFRLSLNSTATNPKVERLVHHYSDYNFASNCAGLGGGYWAQPHASTSPDGSKIIFGSTWGQVCRAEAYVIRLTGTAPPPANTADLNADGRVDVIDLGILLSAWGSTAKPKSDINQDGRVDVVDLGILLSKWG